MSYHEHMFVLAHSGANLCDLPMSCPCTTDVGWTGDVVQDIFASFPKEPDFVCSTGSNPNGIITRQNWPHFHKRTWLTDKQVRACFVMLVRYSIRLLLVFQSETLQQHTQYCEMTGAAMCAMHTEWCSVHTFNQTSGVVGKNANRVNRFEWSMVITEEEWKRIVEEHKAGRNPPGLYHALKW